MVMSNFVIAKTSKSERQKNSFRHLFSFCFREILVDLSIINPFTVYIKTYEIICLSVNGLQICLYFTLLG